MTSIVIRIDPRLLDNPNADLRYVLPELLTARSDANIVSDGFDYVGDVPLMLLFVTTSDLPAAIACVLDVFKNERPLGNDLRKGTIVAIEKDNFYDLIFPKGFAPPLAQWR